MMEWCEINKTCLTYLPSHLRSKWLHKIMAGSWLGSDRTGVVHPRGCQRAITKKRGCSGAYAQTYPPKSLNVV